MRDGESRKGAGGTGRMPASSLRMVAGSGQISVLPQACLPPPALKIKLCQTVRVNSKLQTAELIVVSLAVLSCNLVICLYASARLKAFN